MNLIFRVVKKIKVFDEYDYDEFEPLYHSIYCQSFGKLYEELSFYKRFYEKDKSVNVSVFIFMVVDGWKLMIYNPFTRKFIQIPRCLPCWADMRKKLHTEIGSNYIIIGGRKWERVPIYGYKNI
jgi:hypothetical protein